MVSYDTISPYLPGAEDTRRRRAVHFGHGEVHEHQVVRRILAVSLDQRQRLIAAT